MHLAQANFAWPAMSTHPCTTDSPLNRHRESVPSDTHPNSPTVTHIRIISHKGIHHYHHHHNHLLRLLLLLNRSLPLDLVPTSSESQNITTHTKQTKIDNPFDSPHPGTNITTRRNTTELHQIKKTTRLPPSPVRPHKESHTPLAHTLRQSPLHYSIKILAILRSLSLQFLLPSARPRQPPPYPTIKIAGQNRTQSARPMR